MISIRLGRCIHTLLSGVLLCILLGGCPSGLDEENEASQNAVDTIITFDQAHWNVREGDRYPYREQMLEDIVYNDTVRGLHKEEILDLFGQPDRFADDHMYYRISEKKLWKWTLHQKTMVIRFDDEGSIEWIKIHE